ncbi:MAG: transposon-encoded TnpW family protein [Eubacteriaceae bacterium]|nr:transposon-encoded TnpW family protein [Eubacteriaceae bacterium]
MDAKTQIENVKETPATEPESRIKTTIGDVTYLVGIHFNYNSKETLNDKIKRMLMNEANHPDPAA